MLVLDTDHVSLLQWGTGEEAERLRRRLDAIDEEVAVTVISYEEQTRGWLAYVARARTLGEQVPTIESVDTIDTTSLSLRRPVPTGAVLA